jgi:uncharacterized protein with PIN domain
MDEKTNNDRNHYTENYRFSNTKPECTQVLWKGSQYVVLVPLFLTTTVKSRTVNSNVSVRAPVGSNPRL